MGESGNLWENFKLRLWSGHTSDLQMLTSDLLQVLSLQRLANLQYLSLQCICWELCAPLLRVIVELKQPTIRKLSLDVLLPYMPFPCKKALTSELVKFEEVDLSGCDFRYLGAGRLGGSVYWKDDTGEILTALLTAAFNFKLRKLTLCGDETKVLAETSMRKMALKTSSNLIESDLTIKVPERVDVKWVHFDRSFNFDFDHTDSDSDFGDDFGVSDKSDDDAFSDLPGDPP